MFKVLCKFKCCTLYVPFYKGAVGLLEHVVLFCHKDFWILCIYRLIYVAKMNAEQEDNYADIISVCDLPSFPKLLQPVSAGQVSHSGRNRDIILDLTKSLH